MTIDHDRLRQGLEQLRDAVAHELSAADQREIRDLIDAHEFGVALEWIVDALAEGESIAPPRSALVMIEKWAREMEMYPAVLSRLPPRMRADGELDPAHRVRRWIRGFGQDDQLVVEYLLPAIWTLPALQILFARPPDDPMCECYPLGEPQAVALGPSIGHPLNSDGTVYFLEADAKSHEE